MLWLTYARQISAPSSPVCLLKSGFLFFRAPDLDLGTHTGKSQVRHRRQRRVQAAGQPSGAIPHTGRRHLQHDVINAIYPKQEQRHA
jgi:hypothetical protein